MNDINDVQKALYTRVVETKKAKLVWGNKKLLYTSDGEFLTELAENSLVEPDDLDQLILLWEIGKETGNRKGFQSGYSLGWKQRTKEGDK